MPRRPAAAVTYHEEQRFGPTWPWILLAAAAGIAAWLVAHLIMMAESPGLDFPTRIVLSLLVLAASLAAPVLLLICRLRIEVYADAVHVTLFPLLWRRITLADILDCQPRTYRPIREYGGWGIRWSLKGWAYTIKGNRGVQLTFANRRPLLLGSSAPDQLAAAINTARGAATYGNTSTPVSSRCASR